MKKNTPDQSFHVIAFNASGDVSGDAANITCELSIDGGARVATLDVNPTEIGTTGEYVFSLALSETNGYALSFSPVSSTSGVKVLGTPSNVIYTEIPSDVVCSIRKNEALEAQLRLTGTDGEYISDPSFTAGEVQIWTDSEVDGNGDPVWTNVTDLPQQIGSTEYFLLTLTAAETNYDHIVLRLVSSDQSWDTLEAAMGTFDGGDAGQLAGPNNVTLTITDGTDPIENAIVRMSRSGQSGALSTDSSGQVVFSVDSATWTVSVSASGFGVMAPASLVVSGDQSESYTLVPISVTLPVQPDGTIVQIVTEKDLVPVAGVWVSFAIVSAPDGTGTWYSRVPKSVQSDGNGIVSYEAPKGSVISIRIGDCQTEIVIPVTAGDTYLVDNNVFSP